MELGPLEVLYNWQSILLACGVYALTSGIKRAINLAFESEAHRKANKWVTELLLPALPLLLGFLGAVVVPLRPDLLVAYVAAHQPLKAWIVYGAWGAAIGQFADYLYQRASSVLSALAKQVPAPGGDVPAPAPAPVPAPPGAP